MDAKRFSDELLAPIARAAGEHGLTLFACASDKTGTVASVAQTGAEGQGAHSLRWMVGVEAEHRQCPVYLVLMRRYGNPEGHTYVLGAFHSPLKAREEGEKEAMYRGGKYTAEIRVLTLGVSMAEGAGMFGLYQEAERSL